MSTPVLPRPSSPRQSISRPAQPGPVTLDGYQPTYPGINGASPSGVRAIQRRLGNVPIDGTYGPATRAHVTDYQRAHGLTADGAVGPLTWRSMMG